MIALHRPVEITADNDTMEFAYDSQPLQSVSLDQGVYGSVMELLPELKTKIAATYANVDVYLNSDHKVTFAYSGATTIQLKFTDPDLGVLLGYYEDSIENASYYSADYVSPLIWLPTRETSDPDVWRLLENFKGSRTVNGQVSGVSITSDRYARKFEWPAEPVTNTLISRGTETVTYNSTDYHPDSAGCLGQWLADMRAARPTTDANGLSLNGCYIIHDRSVYEGASPTVALPTSMDSGGIRTELSSSPDRYVWATVNPGDNVDTSPTIDDRCTYQDIKLGFETATAPSWSKP